MPANQLCYQETDGNRICADIASVNIVCGSTVVDDNGNVYYHVQVN